MNKKFSLVLFGAVIFAAIIGLAIAVGKSKKAGEEEAKEALWENIEDTVDGSDSDKEDVTSEAIKQIETMSERSEIRISNLEKSSASASDIEMLKEEISKTKSGIDSVNAGFEASKAGIESAKSSFEEITSKLEKRLQDEDAKIKSEMDSSVTDIRSQLEKNKSLADGMAAEIENLKNALSDKSEVEGLKARVTSLEETLGSLAVSYADGLEAVRAESYEAGFTNGVASGKEMALGDLNLTHAYSYTSGACNYQVAGEYKSFFVVCAGLGWDSAPRFSVSTSRADASVQMVSSYVGRYTSNSQNRVCAVWKVTGLSVGDWIYGRSNDDPFMIMSVIGVN